MASGPKLDSCRFSRPVSREMAWNKGTILDLHWSAPGTTLASGQNNLAVEDHSVTLWSQVAMAFKDDSNVIFDLYNEPHGISWSCWRNGGTCSGVSFPVAGMQQLVNTIRAAGAGNVLMLGCDNWANGCDSASGVSGGSWVQDKPTDPDNNLAASVHIYSTSGCRTPTCFTSAYAPIIQAGYPVIVGEFGDLPDPNGSTATQTFATNLLNWMDQNGGAGYTAWTWNNWGNSQALIASSNGSSLTAWGTYISEQYAQRFG
jgi:endoglucanase